MSRPRQGKLSRREALALMGTCGLASLVRDPVDMLINGVVEGVVRKAQAAGGAETRSYLYIHLDGGPNRWVFDMPLTPYGGSTPAHPHVRTRFGGSGSNAGLPEYGTVPLTVNGATLHMPQLWASSLPRPDGGSMPMSELLEHMVMIRGVNQGQDGHEINMEKMQRPNFGMPSMAGSLSDRASTPLPAVGMNGTPSNVYKSAKGVGLLTTDPQNGNPLNNLLAPFNAANDGTAGMMSRRLAIEAAVATAMQRLGDYVRTGSPAAESLSTMRSQAETLVRQGVGDAAAMFTTLSNKYRALITAVANSQMPGITDRPILPGDYTGANANMLSSQNGMLQNADLRTLIQSTTNVPRLAQGLAVAEYLFTSGYSTSVMMGMNSVSNLLADTGGGLQNMGHSFDEHPNGTVVTLIADSFLYRAIAACLYEFITVMKGRGMWNEMVIHFTGDFMRIPRDDFMGSDHGWSAGVTSIWSGAITAPIVLGDVISDSTSVGVQRRPGNWGTAAKLKVDGVTRELTLGNTSSTIAKLLRVPALMPNYGSLLVESSNGVSPTIDLAKNKES